MFESGAEWSDPEDPCSHFKCVAGVVTESVLQCYTPCSNPLPARPGQCCPTCLGELSEILFLFRDIFEKIKGMSAEHQSRKNSKDWLIRLSLSSRRGDEITRTFNYPFGDHLFSDETFWLMICDDECFAELMRGWRDEIHRILRQRLRATVTTFIFRRIRLPRTPVEFHFIRQPAQTLINYSNKLRLFSIS